MENTNAIRYIVQSWGTSNPRTGRYNNICRITRTSDAASVYLSCPAANAVHYAKALAASEGGEYGYPSVFQCDDVPLGARDFDRKYNALNKMGMFSNLYAYAEEEISYDEWAAKALAAELDKAKESEA